MTTEYPLSLAEARAALVNQPPRTEVADSDGNRWTRDNESWAIYHQSPEGLYASQYGPMTATVKYRIIPIGHPDHSEYVAPIPYKLLTADEALALGSVWVVTRDSYGLLIVGTEVGQIPFNHLIGRMGLKMATIQGWPIVATREEAEALLKERA